MTAPTAIEHVTMLTSHTRMSPRNEVSTEIIDHIRERIAMGDGKIDKEWSVEIVPSPDGGHVFDILFHGRIMVRCWLCTDEDYSAEMWRAAMSPKPAHKGNRPKHIPWLAVEFAFQETDPILKHERIFKRIMQELGDLERCIAWALIE